MTASSPPDADTGDRPLLTCRATPGWMESFHFFGYDPQAQAGFWLNMSSSQWDHKLWREVVVIFLPGCQLLLGKAWGVRPPSEFPSAAGLKFRCRQPHRRWELALDSALQPMSAAESFKGRVRDDARVPVWLGLDVACTTDPWRLPLGPEPDAWYAQRTEFTGVVTAAEQRFEFTGLGFRDHSRGARDFGLMGGHTLVSIGSGPGEWLHVMQVRNPGDGAVVLAAAESGRQGRRTAVDVAPFAGLSWPSGSFPSHEALEVSVSGHNDLLQLESLVDFAMTLKGPNDFIFGAGCDEADLVCVESVVKTDFGDSEWFGLLERAALPAGRHEA